MIFLFLIFFFYYIHINMTRGKVKLKKDQREKKCYNFFEFTNSTCCFLSKLILSNGNFEKRNNLINHHFFCSNSTRVTIKFFFLFFCPQFFLFMIITVIKFLTIFEVQKEKRLIFIMNSIATLI